MSKIGLDGDFDLGEILGAVDKAKSTFIIIVNPSNQTCYRVIPISLFMFN